MYAKLWAASGVDYPTLVDRLVALAVERHGDKQATAHHRALTRVDRPPGVNHEPAPPVNQRKLLTTLCDFVLDSPHRHP